jgi:hypothetical protein
MRYRWQLLVVMALALGALSVAITIRAPNNRRPKQLSTTTTRGFD